jgi:hypothetical protein
MCDKMELLKLKSTHDRTFFSRGKVIKPGEVFEDTTGAAKELVGRGIAEIYSEEKEKDSVKEKKSK